METIFTLIFSYLVFVTRTWGLTRAVVVADFVLSILYDFTPLRRTLGYVETAALVLTLALWLINLIADRKRPAPKAPERPAPRITP
ncbi:MAG: hypothetical protein NVS3B7_05390 [Candidatus Elarobacter sp.]